MAIGLGDPTISILADDVRVRIAEPFLDSIKFDPLNGSTNILNRRNIRDLMKTDTDETKIVLQSCRRAVFTRTWLLAFHQVLIAGDMFCANLRVG